MSGNIIKAKNKLKLIKNTKFEKDWSAYFEYLIFYYMILTLIVAINTNQKILYKKYKYEIKEKKYDKNKYMKKMLIERYGKLKTFIFLNIIVNQYYLSKPIVKIALKIK